MLPNVAGTRRASSLARERRVVPGLPELDRVLPLGGLVAGSLVDLHADEGSGALWLALRVAGHQQRSFGLRSRRSVVLVDATGDFYPPAAQRAGVDLERLVVLRSKATSSSKVRTSWVVACVDEALRSRAVAAVVAPVRKLDGPESHRLRIAAEKGGGLGLLVRPQSERSAVSAAAVRLVVRSTNGEEEERALEVEPLRVRGGIALGTWRVS